MLNNLRLLAFSLFVFISLRPLCAQSLKDTDAVFTKALTLRAENTDTLLIVARALLEQAKEERQISLEVRARILAARAFRYQMQADTAHAILEVAKELIFQNPTKATDADRARLELGLAEADIVLERYYEANIHARTAVALCERIGDTALSANAYTMLGNSNVIVAQYPEALEFYEKAHELNLLNPDTSKRHDAVLLMNIALAYANTGQPAKAMEHARKSMQIQRQQRRVVRTSSGYHILSSIYEQLGQIDSAAICQQQAVKLASLTDPTEKAYNQIALATLYTRHGNIAGSEAVLNDIELTDTMHFPTSQVEAVRAKNLLALGKFSESIRAGRRSFAAFRDSIPNEGTIQLALLMATAFEKLRQPDSAMAYYQRAARDREKLYGPARQKRVARYYSEIEAANDKVELRLLAREKEIIQTRKNALYVAISLGGIFVFMAFAWMRAYQRSQEQKDKLTTLQLSQELNSRDVQLQQQILRMIHVHNTVSSLEKQLKQLSHTTARELEDMLEKMKSEQSMGQEWSVFEESFASAYAEFTGQFFKKFPDLTGQEKRLVRLLKINLSTVEIATLLNVEPSSVKTAKYRLKKKLGLAEEQDIAQFIQIFA